MKLKNVVIIVVIVTVILCLLGNTYAINLKNENTVVFYQGMDNIDTDFTLNVEENENVKKGKFAPGMKATLQSYIDVSNLDFDVELEISEIQETADCFDIKYMIDGENYLEGNTVLIKKEENRIKKLDIEIVWVNNDFSDSNFAFSFDKLVIPFNIQVKQVLK